MTHPESQQRLKANREFRRNNNFLITNAIRQSGRPNALNPYAMSHKSIRQGAQRYYCPIAPPQASAMADKPRVKTIKGVVSEVKRRLERSSNHAVNVEISYKYEPVPTQVGPWEWTWNHIRTSASASIHDLFVSLTTGLPTQRIYTLRYAKARTRSKQQEADWQLLFKGTKDELLSWHNGWPKR